MSHVDSADALSAASDQELMRLCGQGNDDALDVLYRRHERALLRFIGRFLGSRQAAEDVLQETFLRVYRSAPEYQARGKFTTWLYRIASNLCLNELRQRRSRRFISLNATVSYAVTDSESEEVELQDLLPDPSAESPAEALELNETLHEIRRALDELPEGQRRVVSLYVCDDLNLREVADALECSVGTVKSRAHYGLRSVREKLERGLNSNGEES